MVAEIKDRLIEKSIESFLMAIEVFNKPTIKYRVEGFVFFVCNAWELLFKSHIVNASGEHEIFYKDNPDRTISINDCLKKCLPNDKDPVRLNLERIIELRNTSTHFIIPEYEHIYGSVFQACLNNYQEKLLQYHGKEITNYCNYQFLTLVVPAVLDEDGIKAKYPAELVEKFFKLKNRVEVCAEQTNEKFAISIRHELRMTRNKGATPICVTKTSDKKAQIIHEIKDPQNTHTFTSTSLLQHLIGRLKKSAIRLFYKGQPKDFTKADLNNLVNYFGIKSKSEYCYTYTAHKQPSYTYSQPCAEFLLERLTQNPKTILDLAAGKKSGRDR